MAAAAMSGLLARLFGKKKRSLISEPINIVTGALGAGKTLFAIEQADLLRQADPSTQVYQLNINKPDLRKLPELPFPIEEWAERADAGELKNAVIIIDEFHKLMPQRAQNSRPPKFIEEMAEARKRDVRFLLLTQSSEFDHFLKGTRLNRHFYVSRKSGLGKAAILEWSNRFVSAPEENTPARKAAMVHLWNHPVKEYGDWYESAKAHRFRARIPLRIWAAIGFVPLAMFIAYRAVTGFSGLVSGEALAAGTQGEAQLAAREAGQGPGVLPVTTDLETYMAQFRPLSPALPWSAPAYQGRAVVSEPDLYCIKSGPGLDALGRHRPGRCRCVSEQGTKVKVDRFLCETIVEEGLYNPFRRPLGSMSGDGYARGEPDGKASQRPQPVARSAYGIGDDSFRAQQSRYGQMRSAPIPADYSGSTITQ